MSWSPSLSKSATAADLTAFSSRIPYSLVTSTKAVPVFFNTCTETISQLPAIPLDKKNPEDVDTKAEDHLYDALRYGIMSRPRFSIFDYDPTMSKGNNMPIADSTFGY